jgi:hypothetical protein
MKDKKGSLSILALFYKKRLKRLKIFLTFFNWRGITDLSNLTLILIIPVWFPHSLIHQK